jgi:threonine aldolase
MYSFKNDYSESAHPNILKAIIDAGVEQNDGYGMDSHCENAKSLIRKTIQCENVDIHFIQGGTIANLTFISYALKPYQAVISADVGHINIHETGAIEASGHKILDITTPDGKLTPELIQPVLDQHQDEHWVQPKMVFISNPTEVGTIYCKSELERLSKYCKKNNMLLYLDGARLAMSLTAQENDIAITDLPKLVDAFYIGGTKVGALFGEALILINDLLKQDFRFNMKQRGAIMAKGWLLGMQFEELFKDDLYFKLGLHANNMASLLKNIFEKAGFTFLVEAQSNQLFPILPNWLMEKISQKYSTSIWSKPDNDHTCVRFCTSWATKKADIISFEKDFYKIIHEGAHTLDGV